MRTEIEFGVFKFFNLILEECFNDNETASLIAHCLAGLEQCLLRFPEHYKSLYRMAHFFYYNKIAKNSTTCRQLLLETYSCQFYQSQKIQGLFTDRKSTNFFNVRTHGKFTQICFNYNLNNLIPFK